MFRIQQTLQRNCNLLWKYVSILHLFIKVYININKPCRRIDQKLDFISRHSSRFKKDHDSAISGDLYSMFTWYHPSFFSLFFCWSPTKAPCVHLGMRGALVFVYSVSSDAATLTRSSWPGCSVPTIYRNFCTVKSPGIYRRNGGRKFLAEKFPRIGES